MIRITSTSKHKISNMLNPNFIEDKELLKKELKHMVLNIWSDKALCYTEYPISIDNKKYIIDIAVFVYKEFPIKQVISAIYGKKINISSKVIFDAENVKESIAYMTSDISDTTKKEIQKVFDSVVILDIEDLIEFYHQKLDILEKMAKGSIVSLFEFDKWYNRNVLPRKSKRSDKLLQIRVDDGTIELFNLLKKTTNIKTNKMLLLWIMWKATLYNLYEILEKS